MRFTSRGNAGHFIPYNAVVHHCGIETNDSTIPQNLLIRKRFFPRSAPSAMSSPELWPCRESEKYCGYGQLTCNYDVLADAGKHRPSS